MKVYDAKGMLLGRLCSRVAKDALLGQEVHVVNCEQALVSGKKQVVFAEEKQRRARRGYPLKSAKRVRFSDRYVRRVIRGMLPWKQARGKEAFDRVMCHVGVPSQFEGKELLSIKDAQATKLSIARMVSVAELIKYVGGKE